VEVLAEIVICPRFDLLAAEIEHRAAGSDQFIRSGWGYRGEALRARFPAARKQPNQANGHQPVLCFHQPDVLLFVEGAASQVKSNLRITSFFISLMATGKAI
jgi:hypothetical protein